MVKAKQFGLFLFAIAGCFAVRTVGAEPESVDASPYRLITSSESFRLTALPPQFPTSSTADAIPANLADKPYADLIHRAALNAALEPALVHAVIHVESGYNPQARSHKGAIGLMQVLPDTALRYGVRDPALPKENLKAGTLYLKDLMLQFNSRLELVLAAYNAGENAVLRHGEKVPPYSETLRYVPAVLERYRQLKETPAKVISSPHFEYIPGTRLAPGRLGP